jgi:hypothetical protein
MTIAKLQRFLNKTIIKRAKFVDKRLGTKHYSAASFKNLAKIIINFKGVSFRVGDILTSKRRVCKVMKVTPKTVRITTLHNYALFHRKDHKFEIIRLKLHWTDDDPTPFVMFRHYIYRKKHTVMTQKKIQEMANTLVYLPVAARLPIIKEFLSL